MTLDQFIERLGFLPQEDSGNFVGQITIDGIPSGLSIATHGGPDGKLWATHGTAPNSLKDICYTHEENDSIVINGLPG